MATDDRWSTWQAEYAGTNRLPTIWSVFLALGLVAAFTLGLFSAPTATADSASGRRGRCAPSTAPTRPGGRSAPRPGAARPVRLLSGCCPCCPLGRTTRGQARVSITAGRCFFGELKRALRARLAFARGIQSIGVVIPW